MSDTADEATKLVELIESKVTLQSCELCSNNDWVVPKPRDGSPLYISINNGAYVSNDFAFFNCIEFIPLTCSRCGNTKFLNKAVLNSPQPPVDGE